MSGSNIYIYDFKENKIVDSIIDKNPDDEGSRVVFVNKLDESRIIIGMCESQVWVYDLKQKKAQLLENTRYYTHAAIKISDAKIIICNNQDLRVLDTKDFNMIKKFEIDCTYGSPFYSQLLSNGMIATTSEDGRLYMHSNNLEMISNTLLFDNEKDFVRIFIEDDGILYLGTEKGDVYTYDLANNKILYKVEPKPHKQCILSMNKVGADMIVTSSIDKTINLLKFK